MALNGILYGTTNNQYIDPVIRWSAVQSAEGNYSDVTATLYYSRNNTGYTTYGTWEGSLSINGEKLTGGRYIEITYNSSTEAITHTVRVPHNADGTKSVLIEASGGIPETSMTTTAISGTVSLNTIPRASTIAAGDANIGATAMIAINRKSSTYTHSIAYKFGNLSGYITSDGVATDTEVRFSGESLGFHVPTAFYDEIPDDPSGVCTLTIRTYSGDTQIGQEQTAQFTATAAKEQCKPLISGSVVDINEATKDLTGNENVLVRFCSTAQCTLSAEARNGATIAKRTIGGKAVSENSRTIEKVETDTVVFYAKDSRGYENDKAVTKPFVPYVKLTCVCSADRTDPTSGNAILKVKGDYFSGSFGAADNTLTIRYKVGRNGAQADAAPVLSGDSYTAEIPLSGLDYDQSYTVYVEVSDQLSTKTVSVKVKKGLPVFDWGENDFVFHVPVVFESGFITKNLTKEE